MSEQTDGGPTDGRKPPRIRLGMVGGGQDAFIGGVHRIASRLDDHYTLLAGAFSSSADLARLGPRDRRRRRARLRRLHGDGRGGGGARGRHRGGPVVRQARAMVASGELGEIRVVQVEYAQDWLAEGLESTGQKQAGWRTDPERSGAGGSIGDIGTHAFNLATFVTGLALDSLAADTDAFVPGRRLDDNAHVMLRFAGGAKGLLWSSQIAPGNENGLRLRVYGSRGGLEWSQEEPNTPRHSPLGEATRLLTRGGPGARAAANAVTRLPAGHPEGYLEGFATLYTEAARAILARRVGDAASDGRSAERLVEAPAEPSSDSPSERLCPTVQDGLLGVAVIDAVARSSAGDAAWVTLRTGLGT